MNSIVLTTPAPCLKLCLASFACMLHRQAMLLAQQLGCPASQAFNLEDYDMAIFQD